MLSTNKNRPSKNYIGSHSVFALAIILSAGAGYAFLSQGMPDPESLSRLVFFSAAVFGGILFIVSRRRGASRVLFVIPLLAVMAFLDEIAYGSELFDVRPIFYWAQYNVEVRDLHTLIGFLIEIVAAELNTWNLDLLVNHMLIDGAILFIVLVFIAGLRWLATPEAVRQKHVVGLLVFFSSAAATIPLFAFLLIPGDPRNDLLFGLSAFRLILILLFLVLAGGLMTAGIVFYKQPERQVRVLTWLESPQGIKLRRISFVSAGLAVLAVLIFQVLGSANLGFGRLDLITRMAPLVNWILLQAALLLVTAWARIDWLFLPMCNYPKPLIAFFQRNPAFIYIGAFVVLLLMAQVVDKGWLAIGDGQLQAPNGREWNAWAEESLEAIAALQLGGAVLVMPLSWRRTKQAR